MSLMHVLETFNQDCFMLFRLNLLYFDVALDWNVLHYTTSHSVKNLWYQKTLLFYTYPETDQLSVRNFNSHYISGYAQACSFVFVRYSEKKFYLIEVTGLHSGEKK